MTQSWRATTWTGSRYMLHELGDGSRWLTVETPPSSVRNEDLRGLMMPLYFVAPWPPQKGSAMLLIAGVTDCRAKIRRTSRVMRVEGPLPGGEA